jgi:hypothetical protein
MLAGAVEITFVEVYRYPKNKNTDMGISFGT